MVPSKPMIAVAPVAFVRSPRSEIRDDDWGGVVSRIELAEEVPSDSLDGIEEFTHVEAVYFFDQVPEEKIERGARHPRSNPDWPKVGIFAQRGKNRPNRIGVSVARLLRREGRTLVVQGLDAIDGTPVLDIKPVMKEFLATGPIGQPKWSSELMGSYREKAPAGPPGHAAAVP
jgi:tRNA (adenine37-N6)-methyltransferase